nr:DegT/DnrJ/EryC1/StrS family aminotransferase [Pleionea sp. CnH1-48]
MKAQYRTLQEKIDNRIKTVLSHGGFIMGPEVYELEERLAEFAGTKYAIGCANGTDALQLSLMALGVKPGDAVFCPTFTFFATAEVIALCGATPVFVDSELSTFNMCPQDLDKKIKTILEQEELTPKAVIAVDLFGLPANYPELQKIIEKYDLLLIEDAAQGFGGEINGKRAGSFGDIATTSFFPAKPLGCYGDGGAIFTSNDELASIVKSLRVHGKGSDKYDNVRVGVNSRLDTIQAAILLEKLQVFPEEIKLRNKVADKYTLALSSLYSTPQVPDEMVSSWAQYTLTVSSRDAMIDKLSVANIPSMVYYRTCMHEQTAFKHLGKENAECPQAEALAKQVVSLPMHPYLSDEEIDKVTSVLAE